MNAITRSITRLSILQVTSKPTATRTFTSLSPLRPSLQQPSLFRRAPTTSFTPTSASGADVVPTSAITSHPALSDPASAIRCGPRNTMNGATRLVQKRRLGFLARKRSRTGRKILLRRKLKGRREIAH